MTDRPTGARAPLYVPLRVHSAYSLLEGALQVKRIAKLAADRGLPAVGLADTDNLFGALEFSEAMAAVGVQPIVGLQLTIDHAPAERPGEAGAPPAPIVLYAQSEDGFSNLMALSSHAYLDHADGRPRATWARLEAHAEGLICLTGGPDGPLGRLLATGHAARAEALAARLARLYPDRLYVEIRRHGAEPMPDGRWTTPAEAACEAGFLALSDALDLPIVAVSEAFYEAPDMVEAHDAMLCIADGAYVSMDNRRKLTPEHWFKPAEAVAERFADLPEALEATVEIARRCAYRPSKRAPILPRFADDEVAELRRLAHEGLTARLAAIEPVAPEAEYRARLDFELGVIERMKFPGYFLIVADFIQWAKAHDIPVGPGRGSGAGSLVAYALTITNLDPLRYQLLFERFLNPERVSMPDFDIDFCQDRREEVISYVQSRYGRDRVAQIITFGALLSKAAVRDVGRVLQLPFGKVDGLAKMVPVEGVKPVSIAKALEIEPRLSDAAKSDPAVAELLDIARRIEGLYRNASTHAAGVVIGDRPLEQLTPLYRDPRSDMPVTQYSMKWVELAGLVKFDFLGLKTLTVIRGALDLLAARGVVIDIDAIPLDDPATFALYSRAEAVAVFQVESQGMRDALRQLQPTRIEDIIALVALYRPGPMENIPKYCNVKHGREPLEVLHPLIEPILSETQGIIVYQEQVMQIAQVLAGYSLGGADLLRRAMGKKDKAAMDLEQPKFLAGAAANGVAPAKAKEIWDLLEKFADYGFNKSHAAAYALVSYQTAWLKANHPVEFMAAVMNLDMHATDKLAVYRDELIRMKIALAPPDFQRSEDRFTVETDETTGARRIRYALGAVKGVGREATKRIVAARAEGGPFADLFDLARRVELKAIGKRALESLARAGAFDTLEPNRRRALEAIDTLLKASAAEHEARGSGQASLFGLAAAPPPRLPSCADFTPTERLAEEASAIGFYISGHPLDDYLAAMQRNRIMTLAALRAAAGRGYACRLAGVVISKRERKSQKGTSFAFVMLSDPTGVYEAVAFSETLAASRALLEPGSRVALAVDAERSGDDLKIRIAGVEDLDSAVAGAAPLGLEAHVGEVEAIAALAACLGTIAGDAPEASRRAPRPPKGFGPVHVVLAPPGEGFEARVALPGWWPVSPQVRGALKALAGVQRVEEV